jgi:hypothetical protein
VFVQINEAHSDKWPLGFTDHPPVQCDFEERLEKARFFATSFPYKVYVDSWKDLFEETYHAWPDKYILIEMSSRKILAKSEYSRDALVINDYAQYLEQHI